MIRRTSSGTFAFSVDADLLFNSYYFNQISLMASIISFILSLIAVIALNWILFIAAFVTSLLPLLAPYLYEKKLAKLAQNYSEKGKSYLNFVNESLLGGDEVRAYGRQRAFGRMHAERNAQFEESRKQSKLANYNSSRLSYSLTDFSFLTIITLSIILTVKGQVTLGTMMAIINLIHNIVIPLGDIATSINELNSAKNIKAKYENLPVLPKEADSPLNFNEAITISDLSYFYPDASLAAVSNLSLQIPKTAKPLSLAKPEAENQPC